MFLDGSGCFETVGGPLLAFGRPGVGIGHGNWPSIVQSGDDGNKISGFELRDAFLNTITQR
jgi:hypothetical protein